MQTQYRELANAVRIPVLMMGTYPLRNEAMDIAVDAALGAGCRGFDTAHNYENEESLGNSLAKYLPKYGLKREDVFLETKIGETLVGGIPDGRTLTREAGREKDIPAVVNAFVEESCRKLRTDYLDLLMLHWPHPDYFAELWQELERFYRQGTVRAIGVSNCREWHLKKLMDSGAEIMPMVNQIEHHPFNAQRGIIEICRQMNIQAEAYSPLMCVNRSKTVPSVLERIAHAHGRSVSQVVLRWDLQQGIIPLPKSSHPERIRENFSIFDFELSPEEMMAIDLLNRDQVYLAPELYCPGFARFKDEGEIGK